MSRRIVPAIQAQSVQQQMQMQQMQMQTQMQPQQQPQQQPQESRLFKVFGGTWEGDLAFMALVVALAVGALVVMWQAGYFGAPDAAPEEKPSTGPPAAPTLEPIEPTEPTAVPGTPAQPGGGGGGPTVKPKSKGVTIALVVVYALQTVFWVLDLVSNGPQLYAITLLSLAVVGLVVQSLILSESKNRLEILTYMNGVLAGLSLLLIIGAVFARKRMLDAFFPTGRSRVVVGFQMLLLFVLLFSVPFYTLFDDRANTTQQAVAGVAVGLSTLLVFVALFAGARRAFNAEQEDKEFGEIAEEVVDELEKKGNFAGWEALTGFTAKQIVYYTKFKVALNSQLSVELGRKLKDLAARPLIDSEGDIGDEIDKKIAETSEAKKKLGEVFSGEGLISNNSLASNLDERLEDMMKSNKSFTYSDAISALARHVLQGGYELTGDQKAAIEKVDSEFEKDVFVNYAKKRIAALIPDEKSVKDLEKDLETAKTENFVKDKDDFVANVRNIWSLGDSTEKEIIEGKQRDAKIRRGVEAEAHSKFLR